MSFADTEADRHQRTTCTLPLLQARQQADTASVERVQESFDRVSSCYSKQRLNFPYGSYREYHADHLNLMYPSFSLDASLQLFCTTFAILSIFPILAFIGFAICAGSIILATTLVFLVGWLGLIIGSAGSCHPPFPGNCWKRSLNFCIFMQLLSLPQSFPSLSASA